MDRRMVLPTVLVVAALTVPALLGSGSAASAGSSNAPSRAGFIVELRSDIAHPREVAGSNGVGAAEIGFVYRHAIRGYAAQLTEAQVSDLRADPRVLRVVADTAVEAAETQVDPPWNLDRIDQRALPLSLSYSWNNPFGSGGGYGVDVFVLDTGIEYRHVGFEGRAGNVFDAVTPASTVPDCNGHGTELAGVVGSTTWGVAKSANLLGVRVLDCNATGTVSTVLAGLDYVTAQAQPVDPVVALLAFTGSRNKVLDKAVENAVPAGVVPVVAAGNDGGDACKHSPSRAPSAVVVGATDATDQRPVFSGYGACVSLFAPGVNITSLTTNGQTFIDGLTTVTSGTSFAAAHVAGAAARVLGRDNNAYQAAQVKQVLIAQATTGAVGNLRPRTPNRLLFVDSAVF